MSSGIALQLSLEIAGFTPIPVFIESRQILLPIIYPPQLHLKPWPPLERLFLWSSWVYCYLSPTPSQPNQYMMHNCTCGQRTLNYQLMKTWKHAKLVATSPTCLIQFSVFLTDAATSRDELQAAANVSSCFLQSKHKAFTTNTKSQSKYKCLLFLAWFQDQIVASKKYHLHKRAASVWDLKKILSNTKQRVQICELRAGSVSDFQC